MLATGIPRGCARQAAGSPGAWILALGLVATCPLCLLLSPIPSGGGDHATRLLWGWSLPAGVLGSGLALNYLGRNARFLDGVAPRTRWWGELLTFLLAAIGAQLLLMLGAVGSSAAILSLDFGSWCFAAGLMSLHLGALGLLMLSLRAPGGVHSILWLALLLWAPEVLRVDRIPPPLDVGRYFRMAQSPQFSLLLIASLSLIAGMLAFSALWRTGPRRSIREVRGSAT